ncbi:NUDIX hydrolase [Jeotgalibacillus haloalkalitolerans]|uniref:NUDIX hydrolase n=1 Tax=Jeotgalibacillus haloalkalitolerans TaxID=3104292 RepID=A0ABU5KNK0_9BACL|nr:NUDIX hydrolase [Jeotgalibacillus sp. HH7-29]MDZ5712750.1 NUDIX hydrolase [Jeotgalibacillus sp. HH7-29]
MKKWSGAAAVCLNENNEVLMVKSFGSDAWAVPSGGMEEGETPEECCAREVMEETGYEIEIMGQLFFKKAVIKGYQVETYYFNVKKLKNSSGINDPDKTIEKTAWMSQTQIENVNHVYPEDKNLLKSVMKRVDVQN